MMPAAMSASARLLLGGTLAMALVMGIGRFYFTPMLPLMQQDYGFDAAVAGLIASANFAGYLAGSIAASFIRPGRARLWIFRLSVLASVVTTGAMGLTDNTTAWIVLRTASGIASALAMICTAMVVSEALFKVNEAGRVSWIFVGVGAGIAVSGLLTQFAGGLLTSAQMWYLAAGLCVLLLPFIFAEMRDRDVEARRHVRHRQIRQPRPLPFAALLVSYTCEGLGYSVFATFIVAIVKSTPAIAGFADWMWVTTGVAGAVSILIWAAVAGRVGYAFALAAGYGLQIIGTALPAFGDSGAVAILAAVLFGGTFMGITMLTLAVGRQSVDGRGIAILTAGFGLGQMVGPYVAGSVVTRGVSYSDALIGSAAILLFGLVILMAAIGMRSAGILEGRDPVD